MKISAQRKLFSLVSSLFLMFSLHQIKGQPCLTIGSTDGINAPFDVCGGSGSYNPAANLYSADASLYLSTEMCGFGTINSISFYCTNTWGSSSFPVVLYMKTQVANTLSAGTYANMLSGATMVYSGSPTWPSAACVPCYMTLTLSTPFNYASGNLIIISETNRGGIPTCGTAPVFGYNTKPNTHEYWWHNSPANRSALTGSIDTWRNGLQFTDMVVLPVELEQFSAHVLKNKVKLDWMTATETNNNFFTVERSGNGIDFYPLKNVTGAGNSSVSHHYTVFDESPSAGMNYYRLRQTDKNGKSFVSGMESVDFDKKPEWLSDIAPNPSDKDLSFDVMSPIDGTAQVQLTDLTGRIVYDGRLPVIEGGQNLNISLESVPKGIYFLRVSIAEAEYSESRKLIKN